MIIHQRELFSLCQSGLITIRSNLTLELFHCNLWIS